MIALIIGIVGGIVGTIVGLAAAIYAWITYSRVLRRKKKRARIREERQRTSAKM